MHHFLDFEVFYPLWVIRAISLTLSSEHGEIAKSSWAIYRRNAYVFCIGMKGATMINRRTMLLSGAAAAVLGGFALSRRGSGPAMAANEEFEVTHTDAEWRELLTPEQYAVLREEATERAFTSPLLHEKRTGTFNCAGCDLPLFASETKFDSGTGWPSFYDCLPGAVGFKTDRTLLFMVRTEEHCSRCGGHLGHVFDDGPPPTGKRHCINGVALTFEPKVS
jgi:peptide-methionine (R)-S-oxide reductase